MSTTPRRILLAKDTINRGDLAALAKWLTKSETPRLTQGPLVRKFEEAYAAWLGTTYAVFCNSGSSANLLAFAALLYGKRLGSGTVLAPAVAWPTTIAPALQLGLKVRLVDADEASWGWPLAIDESAPTAILVDVLGVPSVRPGSHITATLIEDCCGAHGSTIGTKKVGTFGALSTFSFYFGHAMSTIEGGMVCTDDGPLYDMLLMLRSHGWAVDLARETAETLFAATGGDLFRERFTFYHPGFNLRGTDLQAFLGLRGLKRLDESVEKRAENATFYRLLLRRLGLVVQEPRACTAAAPIGVGVLAPSSEVRQRIAAALTAANIEVRAVGGGSMARQPFMRAWSQNAAVMSDPTLHNFPVADRIHDCGFQLPNHPGLTKTDIRRVVNVIAGAL